MKLTRSDSFLAVIAAGGLTLSSSNAALTTGLAYSAFNIPNPDSGDLWRSTEPTGPVPLVSTAWGNKPNVQGGYMSDGGNDNIQVGLGEVWNSVGASSLQDGPASYVTQIYRGYMYDSDGMFALVENIDDSVEIKVNGVSVLLNNQTTQNGAWQEPTSSLSGIGADGNAALGNTAWAGLTAAQQVGNFGIGWHLIEIRLAEFGGTGGPPNQADTLGGGAGWGPTFGFGIAGIGNSPLPAGVFDPGSYLQFDVSNFPNAPDGAAGLRYNDIDPTGQTNIIIPEPGSALLAAALGLVAFSRRRR